MMFPNEKRAFRKLYALVDPISVNSEVLEVRKHYLQASELMGMARGWRKNLYTRRAAAKATYIQFNTARYRSTTTDLNVILLRNNI